MSFENALFVKAVLFPSNEINFLLASVSSEIPSDGIVAKTRIDVCDIIRTRRYLVSKVVVSGRVFKLVVKKPWC